jgi:hypothetical protein
MTFAPIPKLRNIIAAILKPSLSDNDLSISWTTKGQQSYWLSRSSWSIYLIIKFRLLFNLNNQVTVWLPDYFCNESTIQIRSLDTNLNFYPVLSDGKPDLLACNRMLVHSKPDVILYVNYFGECLFSQGLSDIAKKNKAWLVEDSAHCLMPEKGIGSYGDFVIYSPHKLLSIPDGALLVVRNNGPSEITQTLLEDFSFNSLYYSLTRDSNPLSLKSFQWLSKRLLQKIGFQLLYNPKVINNNEILKIEQLPHPKMTKFSQKLLSVLLDLEKESDHRKSIQKQWSESLNDVMTIKGLELSQSKHDFTPYLAKIVSREDKSAKAIINFFKDSKIPISTWPDLPPEVLQNPNAHKNAIDMHLSYVFFPIHSSIIPKNLKSVIRNL